MVAEPPTPQGAQGPVTFKPTPYNPRKPWQDGQAADFKRSLEEFGDLSGIVHNVRTGHLVGGNKRTEAFEHAAERVITITSEAKDRQGSVRHGFVIADGNRFAYREVDWTEQKEKLANLAANKWSAEWEWEGVSKLLQEIKESGMDVLLSGFEQHDLDNLLAADWKPSEVSPEQIESNHNAVHLVLTNEQHNIFVAAKNRVGGDKTDGEALVVICEAYGQS